MKKSKANLPPTPSYNWGLTRQPRVIEGPSMTKQSFTKECDVNEIVKRYDKTGIITHLQTAEGVYADVSAVGSFSEAIQTVHEAQNAFNGLPSGLRAHFGNDAAAYVDFMTTATAEDRDELYAQLEGLDRTAEPPASPPAELPESQD